MAIIDEISGLFEEKNHPNVPERQFEWCYALKNQANKRQHQHVSWVKSVETILESFAAAAFLSVVEPD